MGACVIGMFGGWVYYGFSKFLIMMKIDDAVDAIPVHFANGIWGVIAAGLFAESSLMQTAGYADSPGLFYGSGSLFGAQIIGLIFILAWVMIPMAAFFKILMIA